MVQTWQKPKYAPFEEQAQQEQGSPDLVVLEAEDEQMPADDLEFPVSFGESADCFQVDLLDSWTKP